MTATPDSEGQEQWVLVVRRSFGIPDLLGAEEARRELVRCLEEQLLENGWRNAPRAVADPMADALMALGAGSDRADRPFPAGLGISAEPFPTRDAALQLIEQALRIVDPERLVVDTAGGYPSEVVTVAQLALERVYGYADQQAFDL